MRTKGVLPISSVASLAIFIGSYYCFPGKVDASVYDTHATWGTSWRGYTFSSGPFQSGPKA